MIKISIRSILDQSENRPAGYIDDVISSADSKTGTHVLLTPEEYQRLKQKYDPKIKFLEAIANCEHRGEATRQVKCKTCGDRAKTANVYECLHFGGECTIDHYQSGQAERVCKRCEVFD
jgi:DnaJ-class molecular chaperone